MSVAASGDETISRRVSNWRDVFLSRLDENIAIYFSGKKFPDKRPPEKGPRNGSWANFVQFVWNIWFFFFFFFLKFESDKNCHLQVNVRNQWPKDKNPFPSSLTDFFVLNTQPNITLKSNGVQEVEPLDSLNRRHSPNFVWIHSLVQKIFFFFFKEKFLAASEDFKLWSTEESWLGRRMRASISPISPRQTVCPSHRQRVSLRAGPGH